MEIRVTFRHMEPEPGLKSYAEQEIAHLLKLLHRPNDAQVIFIQEKNRCLVEMNISADGTKFFSQEQADNFYLAFDQAFSKLETQVKKYRDRFKPTKRKRGNVQQVEEGESVSSPEIISTPELFLPKPVTVDEALLYLEDSPTGFIVFRNAENEKVCVLYRREDGNYGLVESV